MNDPANMTAPQAAGAGESEPGELEALVKGSEGESLGQVVKKPAVIVAVLLGLCIVAGVWLLQQGGGALVLDAPEVSYELLRNQGITEGVPIAIRLGPLTVFQISDPLAGGAGASRAKEIVQNVERAVADLIENPGRTITIASSAEEQLPAIVQKSSPDDDAGIEVIRVSTDDVKLAGDEDPKRVARIWAERLTDGLKVLQFGEPPKFTIGSDFGNALETLYLNARSEKGGISTDSIDDSFEKLSDEQKLSLTTFPAPEKPAPEGGDSD